MAPLSTPTVSDSAAPKPKLGATHQPLREHVRDLIRDRIVRGELNPGDRLVERVLADELGVSRVPVREALNLLKGEGFVQDIPRHGVIVTVLSKEDLAELFEVREALEAQSARLASQRATELEITELVEMTQRAVQAHAEADDTTMAELHAAFHDTITRLAHNRILASVLEPLQVRLHWVLRQNPTPDALMQEHVELVQAISERDAERAAAIARRHVATSHAICHELMFNERPAS